MTEKEISDARLKSQKIAKPEFDNVRKIVNWMGAIQAQDFLMAKWAIGVRLNKPSVEKVETAINTGQIIRIHMLRPTWHFISSDDIYWMLQLSAKKIKSSMKTRHKELELTESIISHTQEILVNSLSNRSFLTREELVKEFSKAKIRTDANRLSHILFCAEMDGIICNGPLKDKKISYSLLHEWVQNKKELLRDEALAELAKRYFTSRCPATLEDFAWWSNLSITDSRRALDFVKSGFYSETIGSSKYWFPVSFSYTAGNNEKVFLLPAYDEFLIGYRDRSSSLASVHNKKTVSDNGIFYPTIIVNGQVRGTWKRTITNSKVVISTNFFKQPDKMTKKLADNKARLFGKFLNKETDIIDQEYL